MHYSFLFVWPQLQRHNQINNQYRLQPGSVLEIPANLMRLATASVDFLQGRVTAVPPPSQRSAGSSMEVTPGQDLPEGTQLRVDPGAFVTVRLADGSLLKVQANSEVLLQQLRRKGRTGSLQSVVDVQTGALEAMVPPNPRQPAALNIRTNVASSSVRGTEFGVYVAPDGKTSTAVLQGAVQVQPHTENTSPSTAALLQPGQGAAVDTVGQLHKADLLPPLPAEALPRRNEDAQWLNLPLPPAPAGGGYIVQVSQDEQAQQVLRNGRFDTEKVRFAALPDGPYHLQVRAVDAHGIPGQIARAPLTVKAHPVPPIYQTAPQAVLPTDDVQLQCTPVHGVQAYRIQVASATKDFSQPVLDEVVRDGCALQTQQLALGEYQWRTASIRDTAQGPDQGPFAKPQTFKAAQRPPTPDAAALNWDTSGGTPAMHWEGEPGQSWRIVVARTPDTDKPLIDTRIQQPSWQAQDLGPGTYYLRIQTRDPSGLESPLSSARMFTILPWVRDGNGIPIRSGTGHDVILN